MIPLSKKERGNFFVSLVIIGVLFFLLGLSGVTSQGYKKDADAPVEKIKIVRGDNILTVARKLFEANLVSSRLIFTGQALLAGSAHKLQPGIHELQRGMTVGDILGSLEESGRQDVKITLREGLTMKDMEGVIGSEFVVPGFSFDALDLDVLQSKFSFLRDASSLEGFLFPDTYNFDFESTPEKVAEIMLTNFAEKILPVFNVDDNWYESLVLASILEREVQTSSDQSLVSGILLKRVLNDMPLQVDATVIYGKCSGAVQTCEENRMLREDVGLDSPYNTYRHLGFPPTPISNPGFNAVRASTKPQKSNYWFYLSDPETGRTIYSETLDEHNYKRSIYLQVRGDPPLPYS